MVLFCHCTPTNFGDLIVFAPTIKSSWLCRIHVHLAWGPNSNMFRGSNQPNTSSSSKFRTTISHQRARLPTQHGIYQKKRSKIAWQVFWWGMYSQARRRMRRNQVSHAYLVRPPTRKVLTQWLPRITIKTFTYVIYRLDFLFIFYFYFFVLLKSFFSFLLFDIRLMKHFT